MTTCAKQVKLQIVGRLPLKPWADGLLIQSHMSVPTPWFDAERGLIRLFVSCRDVAGLSRVFAIDIDPDRPTVSSNHSLELVLDLGAPGTFDGDGVLCTSVAETAEGRLAMLYAGFERNTHGTYRLLTGLAESNDRGASFQRRGETPLLERIPGESTVRGAAVFWSTLVDTQDHSLLYGGGSGWVTTSDGRARPTYMLRSQTLSAQFQPLGSSSVLFEPRSGEHGFGRTGALTVEGERCLLLSVRRREGSSYRLAIASQVDSGLWTRDAYRLRVFEGAEERSLDGLMFATSIAVEGTQWILLNGENYGESGVLVAHLVEE